MSSISASGPVMPDNRSPLVYFDANVFIYAMETDDDRGLLARRWVMQVDRGEVRAVTSELTCGEVLPHPVARGDRELVDGYHRLLKHRPMLQVRSVDRSIILRAVHIRAEFNTELPDAIHVATALDMGCEALLTEDERLRLPSELKKLGLSDARYPL